MKFNFIDVVYCNKKTRYELLEDLTKAGRFVVAKITNNTKNYLYSSYDFEKAYEFFNKKAGVA